MTQSVNPNEHYLTINLTKSFRETIETMQMIHSNDCCFRMDEKGISLQVFDRIRQSCLERKLYAGTDFAFSTKSFSSNCDFKGVLPLRTFYQRIVELWKISINKFGSKINQEPKKHKLKKQELVRTTNGNYSQPLLLCKISPQTMMIGLTFSPASSSTCSSNETIDGGLVSIPWTRIHSQESPLCFYNFSEICWDPHLPKAIVSNRFVHNFKDEILQLSVIDRICEWTVKPNYTLMEAKSTLAHLCFQHPSHAKYAISFSSEKNLEIRVQFSLLPLRRVYSLFAQCSRLDIHVSNHTPVWICFWQGSSPSEERKIADMFIQTI